MSESLTFELQTITPLWTGGLDGAMTRVQESGLIGSLRWWYEAVVRGLGGRACDPTEHACIYERKPGESHEQAYAPLCDACQLFGATGWRRRFSLDVTTGQGAAAWSGQQPINLRPFNRTRGWYLPPGWMGDLALTLSGEPQALSQMAALLLFLEQWGGLGAKQQYGYGAFRLKPQKRVALSQRASFRVPTGTAQPDACPDLRDFCFFQARFRPMRSEWWAQTDSIRQMRQRPDQWRNLTLLAQQGAVPVNAALKNYWRYDQRWPSYEIEAWLFGMLRSNERMRSKVNPGWAIRKDDGSWHIVGWVWLPRNEARQAQYSAASDHMRKLLEERSHWQDALNLVGAVHSMDIVLQNGLDAWNAAAAAVSGGIR